MKATAAERLVGPVLGAARAAKLADAVQNVERLPGVRALLKLTVPAGK